jgi:hypothetical protein
MSMLKTLTVVLGHHLRRLRRFYYKVTDPANGKAFIPRKSNATARRSSSRTPRLEARSRCRTGSADRQSAYQAAVPAPKK